MTIKTTNTAWGIRAGKGGKAHELFVEEGVIALEDVELGDLSKLDPNRDSFYSAYRDLFPDDTRTGSAGIAGKFFRFANEIEVGDLIVYPAISNRQVYVGEIVGEYEYVSASDYPHQRTVKWKYVIPKSEFSQAARYELGAARTFFQFKKNVGELVRKTKEGSVTPFKAKKKAK